MRYAAHHEEGRDAGLFRFSVPARARAVLVTNAGGAVPDDRLRISVVRIR